MTNSMRNIQSTSVLFNKSVKVSTQQQFHSVGLLVLNMVRVSSGRQFKQNLCSIVLCFITGSRSHVVLWSTVHKPFISLYVLYAKEQLNQYTRRILVPVSKASLSSLHCPSVNINLEIHVSVLSRCLLYWARVLSIQKSISGTWC